MLRLLGCALLCGAGLAVVSTSAAQGQTTSSDDILLATLTSHQYDLDGDGLTFLLNEAKDNDFFMMGELHGENEIPALLRALWPQMWKNGYRHIAAEVSPWAAIQLEAVPPGQAPKVQGLWTKRQARDVDALAVRGENVLWGCDMEEIQPQLVIRELAGLNPDNTVLQRMVELTKDGYNRRMTSSLLALATNIKGAKDEAVNGISLLQNLLATLRIETNRAEADTKMVAQNERELLMKEQLLAHIDHSEESGHSSKVLLRFGRNHLHRGYDARGISTLGNFVAEFAIAHGKKAFNVGAFAAGGKETLMGETWDADERQDEPAFALLAQKARHAMALYDLRPLRPLLHSIPEEKRTPLEVNMVYWADSYDALICYKTVTPLADEE